MDEAPHIYADRLKKLSADDRAKLRGMLRDPLYVGFLRVVACLKPSAVFARTNPSAPEFDALSKDRAATRLAQIQGWEMYEAAIFMALSEPAEPKSATPEEFPDEANVDLEPSLPPGYEPAEKTDPLQIRRRKK